LGAEYDALTTEARVAAVALHDELASLGLPVTEVWKVRGKPANDKDRCTAIEAILRVARCFRRDDEGRWVVPDYRNWSDLAKTLREAAAKLTSAVPKRRGAPPRNGDRDNWIVAQRKKGKTAPQIVERLQIECKRKGWNPVSTEQRYQICVKHT
jgi:hypothetical protein